MNKGVSGLETLTWTSQVKHLIATASRRLYHIAAARAQSLHCLDKLPGCDWTRLSVGTLPLRRQRRAPDGIEVQRVPARLAVGPEHGWIASPVVAFTRLQFDACVGVMRVGAQARQPGILHSNMRTRTPDMADAMADAMWSIVAI